MRAAFLAFFHRKTFTQAARMASFRFTTGSVPLSKLSAPEDSTSCSRWLALTPLKGYVSDSSLDAFNPKCKSFSRTVWRDILSQRANWAWFPCASLIARVNNSRSIASKIFA